jgi:hypothetical protein
MNKLTPDLKDKLSAILAVSSIVVVVFGIIIWGCWTDKNGVRVHSEEARPYDIVKTERSFETPILIKGRIEYDGRTIVSKERIVEFCDVKMEEGLMKQEMKKHWKEMREGCK